ncbi:ubiA prenyltransferase family protein [Chlamydia ibidis]|uniref:UbiA prenyltransferase family protein n=3 Tax=Chlamydia ibidis TaxID=1405396 RepID=S7KKX9_9CHLA|nr:ubiA prenyltransferase family protein [Chlamydia ibidis]EQM62707.1 ubiA prenyltransferase family protein [Chlamydia ibidis 10-1398/6]
MQLVSIRFAKITALASSVLFLVFGCLLSTSCGIIAAISIFVMFVYPYTKRYSYVSHWILGLVYYLAIIMNFSALSTEQLSFRLFLVASLWGITSALIIAANDIIYAIDDINFDVQEGLYSIPARFGKNIAITVATVSLSLSLISYLSIGWLACLGIPFYLSSIFPIFSIFSTIHKYHSVRKEDAYSCFFWSNIRIALSFLSSMIIIAASNYFF